MESSSFSLPKDWEWKSLGDVIENHDGKRKPVKSNDREGFKGIYPYYGASGVIDYVNEYLFDGEYLLISEDGANLVMRKTPIAFISTGKFWVNNHAHVVKAKAHLTTNKFLEFYLASADISSFITGSAQPKLSQAKMNEIQIPLPPPTTQRRIVAKIDAAFTRLDEAIQLQKQNLARTEELKKRVLQEVFGKGEWVMKKLENVVENHDGKRKPVKSTDRENLQGVYPYYGASGIIDYVNKYLFDGEYLLISEDGANLVVRRTPIAFIAKGKFWVNNHAHVVKAKSEVATNYFLEYFLAYVDISDFITGSAQPKLSQMKMNEIEVPVPPLTEQQKIVAHLDHAFAKINALHAEQTTRLQHLESLKSSILAEAFKGKL